MIVAHAPVPGSAAALVSAAPTAPDPADLRSQFASLATDLTKSDESLSSMVSDHRLVGDGWSPHFAGLAERMQSARDAFRIARPDETKLSAALGSDVLGLSEAAGSLAVMSRQRLTLAEGWATFLDSAIEDATAAAELLAPPKPPEPAPTRPDPVQPPKVIKPTSAS